MNRYSYVLNSVNEAIQNQSIKTVGLFPFNALIDPANTDIFNGKIDFLQSALEALKILADKNYSVILFINQFKSRALSFEQFNNLNKFLEEFINSHGVKVNGIYWCPSTAKSDPYVTPNPGMFHKATENQKIDWKDVEVISSSDHDLVAAEKVKAKPIKIGNGSKWTHFDTLYEWARSVN